MAQGIKFKGRPVGQLRYLTMTMAFSKKSHLIIESLLEVSKNNLSVEFEAKSSKIVSQLHST